MLHCQNLIGDWNVRGKKTKPHLAGLYSLITFTGPQSHLRNHGDTDKVTHDYSSAVLPDWTAPKSLAKRIHQRSLCPCSTSVKASSWCWGCKVLHFSSSGSHFSSFPLTSFSPRSSTHLSLRYFDHTGKSDNLQLIVLWRIQRKHFFFF